MSTAAVNRFPVATGATARRAKQSTTKGALRLRGVERTTDSGVRSLRSEPPAGLSPVRARAAVPDTAGKFLAAAVLMRPSWL